MTDKRIGSIYLTFAAVAVLVATAARCLGMF
jgi:hypothetical protein